MRIFLYCSFLLVLWSTASRSQDLPEIEISTLDHLLLRAPVQLLETENGLGFTQLRDQGLLEAFRPLRGEDINQGVTDNSFWLRFRLRNSGPAARTWVLHHETTYIDNLTVFYQDAGGSLQQHGLSDRLPFASRPLDYRKLAFRHTTSAQSSTDVYVRIEHLQGHPDSVSLNFHLWSEEDFLQHRSKENLGFGLYYGNILTLITISLGLALTIRRMVPLYYALFLAATGCMWLALNGFGFQYLWPRAVAWHNEGFHVIYLIYTLLALQFSRVYLGTRKLMPAVDKVLIALQGVSLVLLGLRLAGLHLPVLFGAAGLLASLCLLPILGLLAYLRGGPPTFLWFSLAWLIYGFTLLLGVASAFTPVLHLGMGLLIYTQLGTVVENLLLLFASATRVVTLDRERRHALSLANTDPLTGLGNRRMLAEHYEKVVTHQDRTQEPLFLMLLDIDQFKQVNDQFGHDAGDRVLVRMGRLLRDISRSRDVSARLGGEEFAVLVQAKNEKAALRIAERIRTQFEQSPTTLEGTIIHHTLSIGITMASVAGGTLALREMIKRADQALYRAKAGGRNRTEVDFPV